jgi:sulfite exporter TauE/SafE
MTPEITVLTLAAASIAFMHTVLGPDHYLPFIAMARARNWSMATTLRVTLICGLGHLLGSVLLGMIGIAIGSQLASLEWLESIRGELAAWLLMGFGLAYMVWGLRHAWLKRPHRHWHNHGGLPHFHNHDRAEGREHASAHEQSNITPWVIFVIFVLGPCEPLIPLLMYPAARESMLGVIMVTTVFGMVTVATMTAVVIATMLGLDRLKIQARFGNLARFSHAAAGGTLLVCGLSVAFLGL